MKQADPNNIIKFPSPIELLWKQYETAAAEKARIYALELAGADDTTAGDAAYDAVEDIVEAILKAEALSKNDLAIKARVLATRGVNDIGSYRPEDVIRFFADVQTFAAL